MTEIQIKDYLKKYRIGSEEQLAKHIEELKRNTKPNNEIIFPLVDLLLNEKSVLLSFFAENKKQETFTRTVTPFFLDEAIHSTRHKAKEEGRFHKDDVITNSSRGEKETIEYLQGIKESNGKTDYSEINLEILDLMAERFTANKHKYPKGNMKKPIDIKSLEWALFRHVKKMIQPIETDEESYKDHLSAVLCNASMILDQLKVK